MLLTLLDNPPETSSTETSKFLQSKKFKLTCTYFSQVTVMQEVELSNFKTIWHEREFSVMINIFSISLLHSVIIYNNLAN